jgi:hypothetical protein
VCLSIDDKHRDITRDYWHALLSRFRELQVAPIAFDVNGNNLSDRLALELECTNAICDDGNSRDSFGKRESVPFANRLAVRKELIGAFHFGHDQGAALDVKGLVCVLRNQGVARPQ